MLYKSHGDALPVENNLFVNDEQPKKTTTIKALQQHIRSLILVCKNQVNVSLTRFLKRKRFKYPKPE